IHNIKNFHFNLSTYLFDNIYHSNMPNEKELAKRVNSLSCQPINKPKYSKKTACSSQRRSQWQSSHLSRSSSSNADSPLVLNRSNQKETKTLIYHQHPQHLHLNYKHHK
ncbi:unnamed protein product, partial [Rotaria magnacalcarata]